MTRCSNRFISWAYLVALFMSRRCRGPQQCGKEGDPQNGEPFSCTICLVNLRTPKAIRAGVYSGGRRASQAASDTHVPE